MKTKQDDKNEDENYIAYISIKDKSNVSKKESEDVVNIVHSHIKIEYILPIMIYLSILLLFNIMSFFSNTFAKWIIEGNLSIDISVLLALIINVGMILLLILFIIYLPKLSKPSLIQLGFLLMGIMIGLLYYIIYINNEMPLHLGKIEFSFFNLILLMPIVLILTIIQIKKKMFFAVDLSILILGILITLIILDIPDYKSIAILLNYPYLFSCICSFIGLSIYYILKANKIKIKIDRTDKTIKMKLIKLENEK